MTILLSNTIDLNVSQLKRELEHLTSTGPFTTKPLKVVSIIPGTPGATTPNDKTQVTILTAAGQEPTQAQLILAQQILDTHSTRNQQDENVGLVSKTETVIGNSETGTITFKNNNQPVWKIDETNNLVPETTESVSLGDVQSSLLSIHTKNITVTSTISSPNLDALDSRVATLEVDPTTKTYVDTSITTLVGGAPELLNTLNELSQALNNEEDFGVAVNQRLSDLETGITNEQINRDAAFQTAQNLINGEASTREAEDLSIRQDIADEEAARIAADTDLDSRVLVVEADVEVLQAGIASSLAELDDVSITNPSENEVLKYNGASWENAPAPATFSGSYNDLTDKPTIPSLPISIVNGGTGQTTTQAAINSLTQVLSATDEHVLTKDAATGNAVWKTKGLSSLNGLTPSTQTFSMSTAGATLGVTSSGTIHTINIPVANSSTTGLVNTSSQTISGEKTLNSAPILSSLTESLPLKLNSSKAITSGLISLTSEVTSTLGVSNGGTGQTTSQGAINILTQVASATNNHVLTKDSATGNATWKPITSTTFALPNGTLVNPSLYFTNDTNTGLFGGTTNDVIGFTANGQPVLTVSGTSGIGRLAVGDGSILSNNLASRFQIMDNDNDLKSGITLGWGAGSVQLYKSGTSSLTIVGSTSSKITAALNLVGLTTTDTNGKGFLVIPEVGTGGYNPTSVMGDQAIIFTGGPIGSGSLVIAPHSTVAGGLRINNSGKVLVCGSTDNGAYNLQCNGTGVWGAGAYVNGSDERIKNNIQPLENTLDIINQLNPVTYQYKEEWSNDQNTQPGFIAQEVVATLSQTPYLNGIVQDGGQYLGLAYQNLIPLLVKAIQELTLKNKELEQKIAALEIINNIVNE